MLLLPKGLRPPHCRGGSSYLGPRSGLLNRAVVCVEQTYRIVAIMARLDELLDALALQGTIVRQLRRSQLALDSACPGWTVRDVLNHSIGVTRKLTDFASGVTDAPHSPSGDLLGDDPALAVQKATDEARKAWTHTDMTRRCHLAFGTFSAETTIGLNLFDVLAHTWDIATAIAVPLNCGDGLWVASLDAAQEVIGPDRDERYYDPERAVSSDATVRRRFLAFVGRSE